jgi:hypothetical protein
MLKGFKKKEIKRKEKLHKNNKCWCAHRLLVYLPPSLNQAQENQADEITTREELISTQFISA